MLFINKTKIAASNIVRHFDELLSVTIGFSKQVGIYLMLINQYPEFNELSDQNNKRIQEILEKNLTITNELLKVQDGVREVLNKQPTRYWWLTPSHYQDLLEMDDIGEGYNQCKSIVGSYFNDYQPFERTVIKTLRDHDEEAKQMLEQLKEWCLKQSIKDQ